jgi:threonine dehydrogenase-like Zn-dependent dehydrogenase
MRALVITGQKEASIEDVAPPEAAPGLVVIDIQRVGICGTDMGLFQGAPERLQRLNAEYPLRIGHEWAGVVTEVGDGVDPAWLGRRATGDTMLGCGSCARCLDGRHFLCATRHEVGVRGGWPGAIAERMPLPATALRALPDTVDFTLGALVEPGGNAVRAVDAARLVAGGPLLVIGAGTIGLLTALFAVARGIDVHVLGRSAQSLDLARSLGLAGAWDASTLPPLSWGAVIDASDAPSIPSRAIELVEPGRTVVLIGISHEASLTDTRSIVRKEVTAAGILGGSLGLDAAIAAYADGSVDPTPLVAATVPLGRAADALAGWRPIHAGSGPKLHIDPTA